MHILRWIETKSSDGHGNRPSHHQTRSFQLLLSPKAAAAAAEAAATAAAARAARQRKELKTARASPPKAFADMKIELAVAAAGGAAQFVNAAASIVSQPAMAAAVLRAAEGPVDGTPAWYPVAAVVCALLSFVPTMAALWFAWPRMPSPVDAGARAENPSDDGHHASLTSMKPPLKSNDTTHLLYRVLHHPLAPLPAAEMRPGGLRTAGRRYASDDGEWRIAPTDTWPSRQVPALEVAKGSTESVHANTSIALRRVRSIVEDPLLFPTELPFSASDVPGEDDRLLLATPTLLDGDLPTAREVLALAGDTESLRNEVLPAGAKETPYLDGDPFAPSSLPGAVQLGDPFAAMMLPSHNEGGTEPTRSLEQQRFHETSPDSTTTARSGEATLAARAAWCEALYREFRGHARFAAQFVVASQALQGFAQAAGEFAPRTLEDGGADRGAKQSCTASTATQLALMMLSAAILVWTQPHSTRRNFDAEMIPTALQAGICVPVALLAARRHSVNATIAAGLQAALDASAMLQPMLSIGLALYDATSKADLEPIVALIRARRAQGG
jgi:hypothetical protein